MKYVPVMLFIMLYKLVLTFASVDEILKCNDSYEIYWGTFLSFILQHKVVLILELV